MNSRYESIGLNTDQPIELWYLTEFTKASSLVVGGGNSLDYITDPQLGLNYNPNRHTLS